MFPAHAVLSCHLRASSHLVAVPWKFLLSFLCNDFVNSACGSLVRDWLGGRLGVSLMACEQPRATWVIVVVLRMMFVSASEFASY